MESALCQIGVDSYGGWIQKKSRGRGLASLFGFFRPWSLRFITVNTKIGIMSYYKNKQDVEAREAIGHVQLKDAVIGVKKKQLIVEVELRQEGQNVRTGEEIARVGEVLVLRALNDERLGEWISILTAMSTGEKFISSSEITEKKLQRDMEEYKAQFPLQIKLLEHKHTLFCERKQRVCSAVGKLQELEKVQVLGVPSSSSSSVVWSRSRIGEEKGEYSTIENSRGLSEYTFCKEDVGCYISVECIQTAAEGSSADDVTPLKLTSAPLGPILAGPARLLDVHIEPDRGQYVDGSYVFPPGTKLRALTQYIGGSEGASEFWWIRIKDGKREQLGEAAAVISGKKDPREYLVSINDVGFEFKVKCTPVRSDGYKGEVFTSKSCGKCIECMPSSSAGREVSMESEGAAIL